MAIQIASPENEARDGAHSGELEAHPLPPHVRRGLSGRIEGEGEGVHQAGDGDIHELLVLRSRRIASHVEAHHVAPLVHRREQLADPARRSPEEVHAAGAIGRLPVASDVLDGIEEDPPASDIR